jgi:membrane-associated protein
VTGDAPPELRAPLPTPGAEPVADPVGASGRPRTIDWRDVACIGPIVLSIVYSYAGIPISPLLIGPHPVLLSALRGSEASMISAGSAVRVGMATWWQALLAPVPISMWVDPFFYWAGMRYGRRIRDFYARQDPRMARRIARGERFFARWGAWTIVAAPFLPVPTVLFYLAAGETRMPFALFLAADFLGTMLWIGLHVSLGYFLGERARAVADAISHYGLWFTFGLIGLVLVISFRNAWRAARAAEGP